MLRTPLRGGTAVRVVGGRTSRVGNRPGTAPRPGGAIPRSVGCPFRSLFRSFPAMSSPPPGYMRTDPPPPVPGERPRRRPTNPSHRFPPPTRPAAVPVRGAYHQSGERWGSGRLGCYRHCCPPAGPHRGVQGGDRSRRQGRSGQYVATWEVSGSDRVTPLRPSTACVDDVAADILPKMANLDHYSRDT